MYDQDNRLPMVLAGVVGLLFWGTVGVVCVALACYCVAACVMVPLAVLMILWAVTDGWMILFGILWALLYGIVKVYKGDWG